MPECARQENVSVTSLLLQLPPRQTWYRHSTIKVATPSAIQPNQQLRKKNNYELSVLPQGKFSTPTQPRYSMIQAITLRFTLRFTCDNNKCFGDPQSLSIRNKVESRPDVLQYSTRHIHKLHRNSRVAVLLDLLKQ